MAAGHTGARVRAEAARAVHAVAVSGRSLDAALADAEGAVAASDRALLRFLSYETVRRHWPLRAQVASLLSRPLKTRDKIIESLLAVGLLQLGDTRVATHAAVTLTVDAARLLRRPQHASLVNAVLRRALREKPAVNATDEVRFNHPDWMLQRLQHDWPAHWQQIVRANDERAPMWLRVNLRLGSRDDYLRELSGDAVDGPVATMEDGLDAALCLAAPRPVTELPGFDDGRVSVQDGAAQLAAPWLLAGGGSRILDACAAPGGKTGHLLELAAPDAVLSAIDNDPGRLEKVQQTVVRLGLKATVHAADASNPETWWNGATFDRILVDAPCSGSGVIRRHPDIRLLRRDADIGVLAASQLRLLKALWPLLSPGGCLLYVTCSVFAEENTDVMRRFLDTQPDAREDNVLPNNNIRALMCRSNPGYQVLPGTARLDGFYFACLEKKSVTTA